MKKLVCILLCLLLPIAALGEAYIVEDHLELGGETLEDSIEINTPAGYYVFAISTPDGVQHTLSWHLWTREGVRKAGRAASILPQGKGLVRFRQHDAGTGYYGPEGSGIQLYPDNMGFTVYRIDPEHEEYWTQSIDIHYLNGQFQVVRWQDRQASGQIAYVRDGKLHYYDTYADKQLGSVPLYTAFSIKGSFHNLPKTLKAAQAEYTAPPKLPAGTLSAKAVKFEENKVYPVYQGPGEIYGQAGGSKAKVSTNDWIQVFGRENDWLLIQYDITSTHMRVGWISASALPKNAQVDDLCWEPQALITALPVDLTDDPLFSAAPVISLPQGCRLTRLGVLGEWAYVEYDGAMKIRGFVPQAMVEALETDK